MEFNEKEMLLIEDYLDGKLKGKELKAFQERLKSDQDFAETLRLRNKMPGLMEDSVEYEEIRLEVGQAIKQQKAMLFGVHRNWIYSAAATIVLLVGIFAILQFTSNDSTSVDGQMVEEADSSRKAKTEEVLMVDNPENYASIKNVEVLILSPLDEEQFAPTEKVVLKWESKSTGQAMLIVKNMENGDVIIEEGIRLSNQSFTIKSKILPAGKYTWFINDSIQSGSFVIKLKEEK